MASQEDTTRNEYLKELAEREQKVAEGIAEVVRLQTGDAKDRHVLVKFRRQCPRLGRFESRVLSRVVPVNRPDRDSLKRANRHIWASRVFVYKP